MSIEEQIAKIADEAVKKYRRGEDPEIVEAWYIEQIAKLNASDTDKKLMALSSKFAAAAPKDHPEIIKQILALKAVA